MEGNNLKINWLSETDLQKPVFTLTVRELMELVEKCVHDLIKQNPPVNNVDDGDKFIRGIYGLAKYLKISRSKAAQFKRDGIFKYHQDGRLIYFETRDVDETVKNLKVGIRKNRR